VGFRKRTNHLNQVRASVNQILLQIWIWSTIVGAIKVVGIRVRLVSHITIEQAPGSTLFNLYGDATTVTATNADLETKWITLIKSVLLTSSSVI